MARATYIYRVIHIPTGKQNCFTVKWEAADFVNNSGIDPENFKCVRHRDGSRDLFDEPNVVSLT